jgi:putative membrane protein
MFSMSDLPLINAFLNTTSAILLLVGRRFIKRGDRARHKRMMLAAFTTSSLFLVSYLTYHFARGTQHFQGEGVVKVIYFLILGSHTILAAVVVPMVLIALFRGLKGEYEKHRRIARWTFPVWLYVSVTGVIIYLMLYQIFPAHQSP